METILDQIHIRALEKPESTAVMYKEGGDFREFTWRDFHGRVEAMAFWLDQWGLRAGERAAIQCGTRWEWTVADLAVTLLGGIMVPIYPQLPAGEAAYILDHCAARFLFCEDGEQLRKALEIRDGLPDLEGLALIDRSPDSPRDVPVFGDLLEQGRDLRGGRENLLAHRLESIRPDDPMTIVYTSGTTGPPKGAVLACRGFGFNTEAVSRFIAFEEGQRTIAYLPLAHVYERFVQYGALSRGVIYCYAESLEKLVEGLGEIRPHLMPGVPRVYEKAHAAIMNGIQNGPALKRHLAQWALGVGKTMFECRQREEEAGLALRLKHAVADRLVFGKIRARLGGRLKSAVVAAAPVSPELCAFFQGIGVPMVEGWGMTETTAPASLSPVDRVRVGTAGIPFDGLDLRIADDGEIQVKGPSILKEYYRDEEATRAAFSEDGYLLTGDLGEIDGDGFLRIVGRKKDIVINSYGKNIAARNIEDRFVQDPAFSGCVVFGDGKKYLTAVLCLSEESGMDPDGEGTRDLVSRKVDSINESLPRFEKVRGFILSDHEFSVESGEVTPTLKVKRAQVIANHRDELEALYED